MAKKVYEKPELKAEKLFEAGAKLCCKASDPPCTTSVKGEKDSKTVTQS